MTAIPFAFLNCGVYVSITFCAITSIQVITSSILFLKSREAMMLKEDQNGNKLNSMFELGF
jgi:hypothetical protein